MRKWLIAFSMTVVLLTAGCASGNSANGSESGDSPAPASTAIASPASSESAASPSTSPAPAETSAEASSSPEASEAAASAASEEKTTELKAAHLKLQLPAEWKVQSGEESFAFRKAGSPVGGLDGLGYSEPDSIESLLPNGAAVDKQETLPGYPMPTVRVQLTIDLGGDEKREELHYYFFLKDKNTVYDLRFDPKLVALDQSERIAKTAEVI